MRKLAILVAFSSMAFAGSASAQPQVAVEPRFLDVHLFQNYAFSGGVNVLGVEYQGVGDTSQSAGLVCAESDFWDTAVRYAGEFGGFRVAAGVGVCQGFGSVEEQLGGFTAQAELRTMFTVSIRAYLPQSRFVLNPYGTAGLAAGYFKVAAAPFESFSGFRPGIFVGVGVESKPIPLRTNGSDTPVPAMRVFFEYRHYEFSGDVLSGGLPFDLDMDTVMFGARVTHDWAWPRR